MNTLLRSLALLLLAGISLGADSKRSAPASVVRGATYQSPSGTKLRILMDEKMAGGPELEVGELTFAPNTDSGEHAHASTETFYVLEGTLEHIVNGESTLLKPGMIGTVRPPNKVRHKTGPAGAKAIVMWSPTGEAARITSRWKKLDQP
jgi:quercetin dioxygenase-like cupin family protein